MIRDVAVIVLFDERQKIILQLRSNDAARLPSYWAFFGGGIKDDEFPLDAVKRETLEELGYELNEPKLALIQAFKGIHHDGTKYVFIEKYDPSYRLKLSEGEALGWFERSETKRLKMV